MKEKALWKILNATSFEEGIAVENISEDIVLEKLDTEAYFTLLDIPIPDDKAGVIHYLQQDRLILKEDTGNWSITNLGAILLAKNLDDFNTVKRKGIRVIHYRGNNKLETIREQVGTKGYAIDFENIIDIVDNIIPRMK